MKPFILLIFSLVLFATSCSVEPEPIDYDKEACHFCKMTISDSRFGAERVTKKGKIFKYDSAECLFRDLMDQELLEQKHIEVTDILHPKTFVPAERAGFLISEKIASPMGENLSAYASVREAQNKREDYGGQVYNFDQLFTYFKNQK